MTTKWALSGLVLMSLTAACATEDGTLPEQATDLVAAAVVENPLSGVTPPRASQARLQGRVDEVARAGSYSYLRVACDDAVERWVVTLRGGIDVGSRVDIKNMGTRRDFHSKRLGRDFDELVFGIVHPTAPIKKAGSK